MDIDFNKMEVGDIVKLPQGRWPTVRHYYYIASEFAQKNSPFQFEFSGSDGGNMDEKGQYYITRIR
jgi:hypothetical protein